MPLQVNATLTAVNGSDAGTGGRDDWDAPVPAATDATAPTGPVKWAGVADAYYVEQDVRAVGPAGVDVTTVRRLIIDSTVARASGVDTDDVLTFTDPTGTVVHARASKVRISELAGVSASLQTARLDLEER